MAMDGLQINALDVCVDAWCQAVGIVCLCVHHAVWPAWIGTLKPFPLLAGRPLSSTRSPRLPLGVLCRRGEPALILCKQACAFVDGRNKWLVTLDEAEPSVDGKGKHARGWGAREKTSEERKSGETGQLRSGAAGHETGIKKTRPFRTSHVVIGLHLLPDARLSETIDTNGFKIVLVIYHTNVFSYIVWTDWWPWPFRTSWIWCICWEVWNWTDSFFIFLRVFSLHKINSQISCQFTVLIPDYDVRALSKIRLYLESWGVFLDIVVILPTFYE